MIAREFMKLMRKILKVHPEANDAEMWAGKLRVKNIGYDTRHKPARIKLEE